MTRRAAIYCRISKDVEHSGLGVERQERECRDLCARHGLEVTAVHVDNDLSAYKRRHRPGLNALTESMEAGEVDVVVSWAVDRITRRLDDLKPLIALLEATAVDVLTVQAGVIDLRTPSGRMVARMLGTVGEYESEHKSARLMSKSDDLARTGRAPGGRNPYGYTRGADSDYVIDPGEAKWLKFIVEHLLDGWSLLRTARELNRLGAPTREGRPWHHSTVRNVVLNPAIAGLRIHRREIAGAGTWEPIIARTTWEQLRATVADPARKRTRSATKYLLSGMVESVEGDHMNGRPEPTGPSYKTVVPAKRTTQVDAGRLEEFVTEAVLIALADWKPDVRDTDHRHRVDVAEIEGELADLARLRGERTISMAEWLAAREPLEAALKAARGKVRTRPKRVALLEADDIRAAWGDPSTTVEDRRQAIAAVVEKVVVKPATRGRWSTMTERVDIRWRA